MKTSWHSVRTVGRYQWLILLPYALSVIFCHWANMGILVVAPKQRFRCMDYSPGFRNLSLDEQLRLMPENRCDKPVIGRDATSERLRTMNRSDFEMEKCDDFVYDHSFFDFTATEQFNLVCDKAWVIPMASTIYMLGFFCAAIGSGAISDRSIEDPQLPVPPFAIVGSTSPSFVQRFGRKTATIGACLIGFVANMICAYSPYLELFLTGRFFVAVSDISCYTCGLVLTTELLRIDQRIIPKVLASTLGTLGTALIGVGAFVYRDSRYLQTTTAMAFFLAAILLWIFAVESPRWLAAESRHEDASEVVRYIATVNSQHEDQLRHLHCANEDEQVTDKTGGPASIFDLFRTPTMRKRTLILIFMWFSLIFVYYALTYNLGSFFPDVRISLMISGVLEMPSIVIAMFTIDRTGRPFASFIFMVLAGLCCFLMIPFVEQTGSTALLALALIGKMMAGNQFFIIYISTQEIFPTVCRNMGLGCCSSVARIAGMLAPQVVLLNAYWPATTVLILGCFGVVGGCIAPFLPDTTGIELAQTLNEGEHFIEEHVFSLRWPTRARTEEINQRLTSRGEGEELKPVNGDVQENKGQLA